LPSHLAQFLVSPGFRYRRARETYRPVVPGSNLPSPQLKINRQLLDGLQAIL
jgi:hypothetical protein